MLTVFIFQKKMPSEQAAYWAVPHFYNMQSAIEQTKIGYTVS